MADGVLLPSRDVINFDRNDKTVQDITQVLFEDIGSLELISVSRRETIEGQNPLYSIISNLSSLKFKYDPTALISRQKPNQSLFEEFVIDLANKIPNSDFYYIDTNGDLVIELENMSSDEIVEVSLATDGTIVTVN